jgi:hypothetical protein
MKDQLMKIKAEHEAWDYLCGCLKKLGCVSERVMHSPVGLILPDFTPREAEEANLMDAIRAWGNRQTEMHGGKPGR